MLLFRTGETTDQGIAIEKIGCYSSQKEGWLHGEVPDSVRRWKWWKKMWAKALIVVSLGRNGRDRISDLGLVGLNNFSRLWGIWALSTSLVPGLGGLGQGKLPRVGCKGVCIVYVHVLRQVRVSPRWLVYI